MTERRLRVSRINQPSRRPYGSKKPVASIRMTGKWLEELGFGIGERFVVRESPGRIELVAEWVEWCGVVEPRTREA